MLCPLSVSVLTVCLASLKIYDSKQVMAVPHYESNYT